MRPSSWRAAVLLLLVAAFASGLQTPILPQGRETLDVDRVAWLHIPKTGTSFLNVLTSWACPELRESVTGGSNLARSNSTLVKSFLQAHSSECPERFAANVCGGHHPLQETGTDDSCNRWSEHKGHFVAMFRQPEQRVISGYWARQRGSARGWSLADYANATRGCVTKMVAGYNCVEYSGRDLRTGDRIGVSDALARSAVERLSTGFAFVGLTAEWSLSVCLFHAMFGGECRAQEFLNVRPTVVGVGEAKGHVGVYNTTELQGWKDPHDGLIYEKATSMFWDNVQRHGVTRAKCGEEICRGLPPGTFDATG